MVFTGSTNVTLYAKWTAVSYSLKDIGPAGGYIFYINPNSAVDGWKYLEAAPASTDTIAVWGGSGTTVSGADGIVIGTGRQNTLDIVAQFGETEPYQGLIYAAKICNDLTVSNGGVVYSDWFLPSKDELNLMRSILYLYGYGGFSPNDYWWSSEYGANSAWYQNFGDGFQVPGVKYGKLHVRASRAF